MSTKNLFFLVAAACLAAPGFAQTTIPTRTSRYTFPLVGLAGSEEIQVNLINLASNPTSGNAASCNGSVTFSTASSGTVIGGTTNFTLAAGQATSIGPSAASNVITSDLNRVLLKVVVTTNITPGVPCSLSYDLNTFDSSTGVTHVFLVGNGAVSSSPTLLRTAVPQ